MYFTHLPQRGLIRVSGPDRLTFLQGLVSNDVLSLTSRGIVYAALLSPQGKFLHDFFLIHEGDSLLIDGEKDRIADLLRRLSMYRLRANVTFESLPDEWGVVVLWGDMAANLPSGSVPIYADPRLANLGQRMAGNIASICEWCATNGMQKASPEAYDQLRLALGIPDGSRDLSIDHSMIVPFGFESLHGIDFHKGCYVGQEVTARTKHLGQQRKHLHIIRRLSGMLPPPGTAIMHAGKSVGTLCSHSEDLGLALIAVDAAAEHKDPLICGEAIISATLPEWAQSAFHRNSN